MPAPVFQKEALARLASPEQLDHLMPLTSPRGWIALWTIAAGLALGVVWMFAGSMAVRVEGEGILIRPGGVRQLTAPTGATIEEIKIEPGELVHNSQPLIGLREASESGAATEIVAPLEGRILDVSVEPHDEVSAGTPLIRLESLAVPLEAVIYVPAADAYRIQNGMEVMVRPAIAGAGRPEMLRGRVKSASRFPSTQETIARMLGSEDLAGFLMRSGPRVKIDVELLPGTADDLRDYFSGTPCHARITVGKFRPVNLIVPARDSP